jgi:hypothetical protein
VATYLRNHREGSSDAIVHIEKESCDLDHQLEALLAWLRRHPHFDFSNGDWIVDIGFEPRRSVDVAGYTISVELMQLLSINGITLWLSDYLNEKNA